MRSGHLCKYSKLFLIPQYIPKKIEKTPHFTDF